MLRVAPSRLALLVAFAVVFVATQAIAQVNPYRVQQRYNEARKGKSIDEWTRRLNDEKPETRLEAVKSLTDSGQPEAIEYLIQATGDPDEAVKCKAIDSLGKLRATAATQVMVQKLFMRDVEPQVKHRILVALGRMGDVKAAQPVAEFVAHNTDPSMKGAAVFALGEIGDQEIVPRLENIQRDTTNPELSRLAGEAIAKINRRLSPSTVAVTIPALEEDQRPTATR